MAESAEPRFTDGNTDIAVLDLGVAFTYRVPSFPAIEVTLRQATIQLELPGGPIELYDGFLRSDPSLPDSSKKSCSPFYLTIMKHCFVPVEEFSKVINVRHLRSVEDCGLLVVTEWVLKTSEMDSERDDNLAANVNLITQDEQDDEIDFDVDDDDISQSSVDFKCIGVTRDPTYQNILSDVRDVIESGHSVPVKLLPEPTNHYDPNAIAFQCLHQNNWKTFGYIVSEVCEEVLDAIERGCIISVEFVWVKYKLWKQSPGFYAAVRITRKGEWSHKVKKSHSTFC